jgi:hypothetical protein
MPTIHHTRSTVPCLYISADEVGSIAWCVLASRPPRIFKQHPSQREDYLLSMAVTFASPEQCRVGSRLTSVFEMTHDSRGQWFSEMVAKLQGSMVKAHIVIFRYSQRNVPCRVTNAVHGTTHPSPWRVLQRMRRTLTMVRNTSEFRLRGTQ